VTEANEQGTNESDVAGTDDIELPPALAAAWGIQATSRRGPRPGLSVEQIVQAAIELADQDGLGAVSMGRIAESLGFTTMSLYRYVASKDDLLTLMVDAAYGEPPDELGETDDWRFELEQWARRTLERYRAHPWACDIPINAIPAVPRQLAWLDRLLRGLRSTPLDYQEQLSCALLLSGYVRDWATLTRGLRRGQEERAAAGVPELQFSALFANLVTPDRFPALAPIITAGELDDDPDEGFDDFEADQFPFGLERVLDGIGVLIDRRDAERTRPRKPKSRRPPVRPRA
jgi:AcrR family transcriptional regulator